jgi:hypothetical protein
MWGQAAQLQTETQTEEFFRTVNGSYIQSKPDAQAIEAISEGITKGIIKSMAP